MKKIINYMTKLQINPKKRNVILMSVSVKKISQ